VRVIYVDGSREAFEARQLHPDEVLDQGSGARAEGEQRAKRGPLAATLSWIAAGPVPAIYHRIEEKIKKAPSYRLEPTETLSLLLVALLPESCAVASTTMFPFLPGVKCLNSALHKVLVSSRFENVFLHVMLGGNAVYGWNRRARSHKLRAADDSASGSRQILKLLRSNGRFGRGGLLPRTRARQRDYPVDFCVCGESTQCPRLSPAP
jgi:hypothetical protein